MCKCKGTDVLPLDSTICPKGEPHFYCVECGDPKDYCSSIYEGIDF